jgi:hypothetical protein
MFHGETIETHRNTIAICLDRQIATIVEAPKLRRLDGAAPG